MTTNDLHQLDWRAFCYVANELSATEREQFEATLAVDQVAREAVARAVELGRVVSLAELHEPAAPAVMKVLVAPRASVNWSRRVAWASVGVAASLLLAVLGANLIQRSSLSILAQPDPALTGELASLWTESREELPSLWQSETGALSAEGLATATYLEASGDEEVALAATEAPTWMTAALLAQSGHVSDESAEERMEN